MISKLLSTLAGLLIGWLVFHQLPGWLGLKGAVAWVVRVIGILIMAASIAGLIL